MIEIRTYCADLEEKHMDFASKYWKKNRRKNPEYIYWKFRSKNTETLQSFILALDGEKVVGQLGLIACKINVNNRIFEAQWACDLMVDIDYRGFGVAKLLYKKAHELKIITLGSDPSPAASKSMKNFGYKAIKASWKLFFPMKIGEIFKVKGYNFKLLDKIPNPFAIIYLVWYYYRKDKFKNIDKYKYLEYMENKRSDKCIYAVHDKEFIDWRYNQFKTHYKGIETFGKKNGSIFSGYINDQTYYLTDFYISKSVEIIDIISMIIYLYRKENLLNIKFNCNYKYMAKVLVLFGFIKFRTRTEIVYYTTNHYLMNNLPKKVFYYTYLDSDECI